MMSKEPLRIELNFLDPLKNQTVVPTCKQIFESCAARLTCFTALLTRFLPVHDDFVIINRLDVCGDSVLESSTADHHVAAVWHAQVSKVLDQFAALVPELRFAQVGAVFGAAGVQYWEFGHVLHLYGLIHALDIVLGVLSHLSCWDADIFRGTRVWGDYGSQSHGTRVDGAIVPPG